MTEPDQTEQTPDSVTTHEEVSVEPDGSATHTLDTEVAAGDAAADGGSDD